MYFLEAHDPSAFSLQKVGRFRHNYDQHPLLQLDRLAELAQKLSATNQCRFIDRETRVDSPFHHVDSSTDGKSVDHVFQRIEESGSWIALYNIQTDPTYQAFLWDVMKSAATLTRKEEKTWDVRGFVFISAPPSVTPFHIDRENNFWMQIRGQKTMSVWDRMDRSVLAARDVEDFIVYRSLDNVKLDAAKRAKAQSYDCGAGDGVYFPSTTPHMTETNTSWVTPGNGVAISIGIDFYTNRTRKEAHVHTVNRTMRRFFGLAPQFPGQSAWRDALKYPLGRAAVAFRRQFRGYDAPPGF